MTERERLIGDMTRLLGAAESAAQRVGAPGSAVRRRLENEVATLRAAIDVLKGDVLAISPAALRVLQERRRQVEVEGWTPEHDDAHDLGEIAFAGACYAASAGSRFASSEGVRSFIRFAWPWARGWWKPKGPARDLERAGALIIAELERLDRAAARETRDA